MKLKNFMLALMALLAAATAAFADYTEFKATVVEFEDGQKTENKIWITNDRSRREFNNGREIVVTRNDKKVTWFIYPTVRCYVETPALGTFANFNMPDSNADTGDLKRKLIGEEERDGFRMKKYLVTIKYSNMPGEDSYYEWCRNDFPVPVRTESLDGSCWTEYKNISRGPINRDLFNKPSYKLVDSETAERLLEEYERKHPRKAAAKKAKRAKKADAGASNTTGNQPKQTESVTPNQDTEAEEQKTPVP